MRKSLFCGWIVPDIGLYGGGNRQPLIILGMEEYDCIYYNQSKNYIRPPLHNLGRTIKTDTHPIAVVLNEQDMAQEENKKTINLPPELQGKKFRIRKLTPRECGRLMDVDDADIDKIEASGLSNSAMYKLYGNSIVCQVLYEIFRKMFINTEQESEQLTMF